MTDRQTERKKERKNENKKTKINAILFACVIFYGYRHETIGTLQIRCGRKREELTKRQKEQQLWAARFMSEKLTKLGKQKERSGAGCGTAGN